MKGKRIVLCLLFSCALTCAFAQAKNGKEHAGYKNGEEIFEKSFSALMLNISKSTESVKQLSKSLVKSLQEAKANYEKAYESEKSEAEKYLVRVGIIPDPDEDGNIGNIWPTNGLIIEYKGGRYILTASVGIFGAFVIRGSGHNYCGNKYIYGECDSERAYAVYNNRALDFSLLKIYEEDEKKFYGPRKWDSYVAHYPPSAGGDAHLLDEDTDFLGKDKSRSLPAAAALKLDLRNITTGSVKSISYNIKYFNASADFDSRMLSYNGAEVIKSHRKNDISYTLRVDVRGKGFGARSSHSPVLRDGKVVGLLQYYGPEPVSWLREQKDWAYILPSAIILYHLDKDSGIK